MVIMKVFKRIYTKPYCNAMVLFIFHYTLPDSKNTTQSCIISYIFSDTMREWLRTSPYIKALQQGYTSTIAWMDITNGQKHDLAFISFDAMRLWNKISFLFKYHFCYHKYDFMKCTFRPWHFYGSIDHDECHCKFHKHKLAIVSLMHSLSNNLWGK